MKLIKKPSRLLKVTLFSLVALSVIITSQAAEEVLAAEKKAPEIKTDSVIEVKISPDDAVKSSAPEDKAVASEDSKPAPGEEIGKRKGRADAPAPAPAAAVPVETVPEAGKTSQTEAKSETKTSEKAKEVAPTKSSTSAAAQAAVQAALANKAKLAQVGKTKSKLPANLGTVTSTGSGGPSHYMSKHDAYSAIAEKHGALAQDAMRKSDKRRVHHSTSFGGIQKASGIGDMLSPFKGVTDSGLARTLGASMRSIMKSKYSVPAYVASALLGAVALMAFYESPISPLPVPPLPEPPIGRFPPEMPNLSPNIQVPFRGSQQYNQQQQQQQNYNQRSLNGPMNYASSIQSNVMFPSGQQQAQQRQMPAAGPVQQLNLLLGKQNAQRKSGPDYDQPSSRSFFGVSAQLSPKSSSATAGAVNQPTKQNSLLNFFGLGTSSTPQAAGDLSVQASQVNSPMHQLVQQAGSSAAQSSLFAPHGPIESKGGNQNQPGVLSNSHLVNKVKSYFSRSPAGSSSSSAAASSSANPLDQYQRMSFVQAFMKDTAFLPAFLTPTRKSSSSSNKPLLSSSAAAAPASNQQPPAARTENTQSGTRTTNKGYGTMGRVAHALLETFTSSMARNAQAAKPVSDDSALTAATLLKDIMYSYGSAASAGASSEPSNQPQQAESIQTKSAAAPSQSGSQASKSSDDAESQSQVAQGRSSEEPTIITAEDLVASNKQPEPAKVESSSQKGELVRKTRSVGFEYPTESFGIQQPISKAAQINSMVDFVADSYAQNKLLFNFVMNQVGLSQAVPYVEQILGSENHH